MNFASISIRNKTTTLFLTLVVALGGILAFYLLGQLEDPTFTVKTAVVMTSYPGGSAEEVEKEITEAIETHLQEMEELWRLRSYSQAGLSVIYVDILTIYNKEELPQIWDKLRNKVTDAQAELPPGAGQCMVNSDYGDVFGIYYALTGDGYSYRDLWYVADFLKRELSLVEGVKRAEIAGDQGETIYVEMSRARMVQFGISPDQISNLLSGQNLVTPAGSMLDDGMRLRVSPTGFFDSVESIGDLIISTGGEIEVRLSDVATITRQYVDPPSSLMRSKGKSALGIGVSNASGANVPQLGEKVAARLEELKSQIPAGMQLNLIYNQPEEVTVAVAGFIENLKEAVIIVVVLLLLFTGVRSGILMGAVLLFTILATLLGMLAFNIDFQSVSLAAMIIALGMLVDNAIVISDGMLVRMQRGMKPKEAAEDIVGLTTWPLFGATIIAALAFMPIGFSPDNTGEFCFSIFSVVGMSLMLSWVTAVTVTPLWGSMFLKVANTEPSDPFDTPFYRFFKRILHMCARLRLITIGFIVGLLALSIVAFGWVEQTFFPIDPKPMFTIDVWMRQGTDVVTTSESMKMVEDFLAKDKEVVDYSTFIGSGAMRFVLNYTPQDASPRYGQMLVKVTPLAKDDMIQRTREFMAKNFPDAVCRVTSLQKGSTTGDHIEARFIGDDPDELRRLADKALAIMRVAENVSGPRLDWGERVYAVKPSIIETQARRAGLTRSQINGSLLLSTNGATAGLYREGKLLIPIVMRLEKEERTGPEAVIDAQIWSPNIGKYVPLAQIARFNEMVPEEQVIYRRNRIRALTAGCYSTNELNPRFLASVRPQIEEMFDKEAKPGYELQWGGEYESSGEAMEALASTIPLAILLMASIVMILFNEVRSPLVIMLTVPLSLIGVVIGLLLMRQPFSFMALLGFLSLSGMLIKNSIVLLDQVTDEKAKGAGPYDAIINAAISRARPVMMGAMTTVLGMVPLLWDTLFAPLAVTIMFGLTLATVLTLVIVPVLYVTIYRIPSPSREELTRTEPAGKKG